MPGKLHGVKEWQAMLKRYGEGVANRLERAFNTGALRLAAHSRRIAPVSPKTEQRGGFGASTASGRLRGSITHEVTIRGSKFIGAWGTNVKTAIYVEFGTRPHTIVAKQGKRLRFFIGPGNVVFAKRVQHPGIQVGTPGKPRTTWKRKENWGGLTQESMPFIRPAWFELGDEIMADIKAAGVAA